MSTLVLLPHNDDEFFVSATLAQAAATGEHVLVAYTTYGSNYGTAAATRMDESTRVLGQLGIPADRIGSIGQELDVFDGAAFERLEAITGACLERYGDSSVDGIITTAWEGGHTDHDGTHLVGLALARAWALDGLWEFPIYTAAGAPRPFFRTARFFDDHERTGCAMGWRERVALLALVRHYRSQWRSFVGLLPEACLRYMALGRQPIRRVAREPGAYLGRPHPGTLFYERRFEVPYDDFRSTTRPFIESRIVDPEGSAS